ncbi:MAG TPA: hypothetical protein VGO80_16195 [Solirubrobacteraceae bacterium]|jgi:hypothetical protein|nr:hypothetical protein [Solirubrobacteraceae bacterium]
MSRIARRFAPWSSAVLIASVLAVPATSGAASTTTCKLSATKSRSLGAAYVTYSEGRPGFKMRGTTCATGAKVIKAFHACRHKHGAAGSCTSKVLGYSCTDRRPAAENIPTQYTGYVTCKRSGASIVHVYQQNT